MEFGFGEELERNLRDAENSASMVKEMRTRIAGLTGEGAAADGRIRARFTEEGGLSALDLDPRVLRLPSAELSVQIRSAVNAASEDFQAKVASLSGEFFGGGSQDEAARLADPEVALQQVRKLGDAFAGQMKDVLQEIVVQQRRASEAMDRYQDPDR